MSYCAAEGNSWLSAFNWSRAFAAMRAYDPALAKQDAARSAAAHDATTEG